MRKLGSLKILYAFVANNLRAPLCSSWLYARPASVRTGLTFNRAFVATNLCAPLCSLRLRDSIAIRPFMATNLRAALCSSRLRARPALTVRTGFNLSFVHSWQLIFVPLCVLRGFVPAWPNRSDGVQSFIRSFVATNSRC